MAINKRRYINTKFWNDNYVSELDPIEKLLFIYFLTNEHTNISGVYEIPLKVVAMETGIDKDMVTKTIPRFKEKMVYVRGFIVIKNFLKHQETKSDLTIKGIVNCWKEMDTDFLETIIKSGFYDIKVGEVEGAYKEHIRVSKYLDSNLDLDSYMSTPQEEDTKPSKGGEKETPQIYNKRFEDFWQIYPEKKGKGKAHLSWKKLTNPEREQSIIAIKLQIENNHFKGRDGVDYTPHPATWLNQRRWEDEIKLKKDGWK